MSRSSSNSEPRIVAGGCGFKSRLRSLPLFMTLLMVSPDQWRVTWTPHPENKAIRIVYRCSGGTPFYAFNWFDISPMQNSGTFHRLEPPEDSSSCWATAEIIRGNDDPTNDYSGEYTTERVR